jgi:hypothetical protein
MNIRQVAVLLIRLTGCEQLFNAVIAQTYVPGYLLSMSPEHTSRLPLSGDSARVGMGALTIRMIIYVSTGLALLIFARPLAKLATLGLGEQVEGPVPPSD